MEMRVKKIISLLMIFPLTIGVLMSCEKKIDTSQFTRDNPYIFENFEMSDELARKAFDSYSYHWGFSESWEHLCEYVLFDERTVTMAFRVTKDSSKSYYWEQDEIPIMFTITTMKIVEKINGSGEYYDNLKQNDTIQILEYYSVDPNNKYITRFRNRFHYNSTTEYAVRDLNYPTAFSGPPINSPYVKSNTEYIMRLAMDYLIDREERTVGIMSDSIKLPHELLNGVFCYKCLYEYSESAYKEAKENLAEYEDIDSERFTASDKVYDRSVIQIWENFGSKIN